MPKIVRYGLLSTATIGLFAHLPASKLSANSDIVAVSSRSMDAATAAAERHGIPLAFGNYEDMLVSEEIDAVILTLPNALHHEWAIKAALAGKHVLCEKPLAATLAEAREMAKIAKAQGVVLVEGFTPRGTMQLRKVRDLVAQDTIGDILRVDASAAFRCDDPGDIRFSKAMAGGSLMDVGCYGVNAARFVMNAEPMQAMGFECRRRGAEVDTSFSGLLQFPSGAVAHIWSSLESDPASQFKVTGTRGAIVLSQLSDESASITIAAQGGEEVLTMQSPNRFAVQLDAFSNCVLSGKPPEFPAEDGARNMAAIEALYQSAQTGQAVDVERI
ncbi:Gfo/Idh/MocA family oxidoreductase [Rhodobacteraceae bacterium]|nr:Gfo/Idh/MocA family oxidoreductase [Paracoccaceae bacterium]